MNIPPEQRQGVGCSIFILDFIKDLILAQHDAKSDKAPNLTIGQWLAAQPEAVQRREGLRVLRKYGFSSF
jgi:hypothetical protein